MKKFFVFSVLFVSFFNLFSQSQFSPIQPYQENDYTKPEVKKFALSATPLAANWRQEFVKNINSGLKASGEKLVLDERHVDWAIDQVRDSFVTISNFTNSRRKPGGSEIFYFEDKSTFRGNVGVFQYKTCRLIVYKSRCINLIQGAPEKPKTQTAPVPTQVEPEVVEKVIEERVIKRTVEVREYAVKQDCGCWEKFSQGYRYHSYGSHKLPLTLESVGVFTFPLGVVPANGWTSELQFVYWKEVPCSSRLKG